MALAGPVAGNLESCAFEEGAECTGVLPLRVAMAMEAPGRRCDKYSTTDREWCPHGYMVVGLDCLSFD